MRRRRVDAPHDDDGDALTPVLLAVLLGGWAGPMPAGVDVLAPFEFQVDDLRAAWQTHRDRVLREAVRRQVARPIFAERYFDDPVSWRRPGDDEALARELRRIHAAALVEKRRYLGGVRRGLLEA